MSKHTHDILRERLHKQAGIHEAPKPRFTLKQLEQTEWSPEFEKLMRNRLIMGALRYGLLVEKRVKGKKWDLLEPIAKKLALYERTGNTEYLVDAANYCLLAYECDNHPKKHFKALDDHHDHCKLRRGARVKAAKWTDHNHPFGAAEDNGIPGPSKDAALGRSMENLLAADRRSEKALQLFAQGKTHNDETQLHTTCP